MQHPRPPLCRRLALPTLPRTSNLPPRRAEFRVWHEGDDIFFLMFEKDPGTGEQRQVRV